MANIRTTSQEVQSEILDTVRKSQDAVVDAIVSAGQTRSSRSPRPSLFPTCPTPTSFPSPDKLVASAYDFAEKLLASQRTFAESVLHATTKPLTSGKNGTTPPKASTSAE